MTKMNWNRRRHRDRPKANYFDELVHMKSDEAARWLAQADKKAKCRRKRKKPSRQTGHRTRPRPPVDFAAQRVVARIMAET